MKTYTSKELSKILADHSLWLKDNTKGKRANLTGAYLTGADLTNAYLTGADLRSAYLTGAYLTNAYLTGANLEGANLRGVNLTYAYLEGANLPNLRQTDFEYIYVWKDGNYSKLFKAEYLHQENMKLIGIWAEG